MAISPSPFKTAGWIWPEDQHWDIRNSYALFRHSVTLAAVPRKAPLFITGDQSYQLYINGRYVCRGPARGFQSHWPYDEIDVARCLQPGPNLIAVRAHHPGFSNFQYVTQSYAGLLVEARWGSVTIATGPHWKCRRQTGVDPATVPTSVQLFCQEHIDLRLEDPEWMQPTYDDTAWSARVDARPWNSMPWHSLEERGIPMLDESPQPAVPLVIGARAGRCAPGYQSVRDAATLRHSEGLAHEPCRYAGDVLRVEPTGRNRFQSFLLDFGRAVFGSVGFEITGAAGGEIVDTLHVETIDGSTLTPDFVPHTHSQVAFAHRLTCRPGAQSHTFYHAFGFRYMVVTVRHATAGLELRPLLRTAVYPLVQRGSFRCSDESLGKIWETCAWTQRLCSLDAFVDTPWREQAQWWGDARVQAKNTFFYSGDTRLFRRGIAQIAAQRTPDGLTYGHAPTMAHTCILPDFSLIWLLTLWDFYWQTGSTEPFEAHQDAIAEILHYFNGATDPKKGLVAYDPRYWLFLDWTEIHRTGIPTLLNLWLALALDKLVLLYLKIGEKRKAADLKKWRKELTKSLQLLVDGRGFMRDGYDERGRAVAETSIHNQVLALMAGVPGVSEARVLDEILLPYIREEREFPVQPSSYWITYVFEFLREKGHGGEVVDFIRRHWSPMAAHGTTWETFAPERANESFSHAWSAHPLFHLMQILGGVVQTAPAWERIRFEPCFAVGSCEIEVPTPKGTIRAAWHEDGEGTTVRLTLPRGMEADVALPGLPGGTVNKSTGWKLGRVRPVQTTAATR